MYVVFTDSPLKEVQWLKPNFRHCYCVQDDNPVWTCIHPGRNYLDVSFYLHSEYPTIQDFVMDSQASILKFKQVTDNHKNAHGLNIVSCVGAVKYCIGIQKPFIITPYQLYKYLVQSGELIEGY
jgi:hypothetical protein